MKRALTFSSILYFLILALPFGIQAQNPITYNPSDNLNNVKVLVEDEFVANSNFEIIDVSVIGQLGNDGTIGSFSNALQPMEFEDGIALFNSPIFLFAGGNTTTSAGSDLGLPGDANLDIISQVYSGGPSTTTSDASSLNIDFIPTKTSLQLEYLFASEEYCDFVGSQNNDVMGIFLAGPGIQGPFNIDGASAINIAEFANVPDEIEYVGVNSINNTTNTEFYIDNNTAQTSSGSNYACSSNNTTNNPFTTLTQFDGWTVPLIATYDDLEIGQTYQLRITVADGTDATYGSAIFLKGGSFDAGAVPSSVTADAGPDQVLTCVVSEVTLGGTNTGVNFTYEWTGPNGIFSSEPNPQVNEPGLYILTVTDPSTGETATDEVEVNVNQEIADFEIDFTTNILTCENSSVLFTVVLDDPSIDASYEWQGPNGSTISTDDEIVATEAGSYSVVVTNISNGCSGINSTFVLQDEDTPIAFINTPELLSNMSPSIVLDASGSTQGAGISYQWTSTSAGIVSGANTLSPTVNQAGTYCLTVANSENGCEATTCVDVLEDFDVLTADAGPDQIITCTNVFVTLGSASNPTGSEFSYEWIFQGQNVGAEPFLMASGGGQYFFFITNTTTGESSSDEVIVFTDTEVPFPNTFAEQELDCENSIVLVQSEVEFPNLSYLWTSQNGNILSDPTQPDINVDQEGEYTLTITGNSNGCTNQSTTTVISNQTEETTINVPTINSTEPDVMLHSIDFVDEENEGPHDFVWSDQNGPFDELPSIVVDQSGVYTLTATNIFGCVTTVIFTVNFGQNLVADAGPTQDLNCVTSAVTIGSTNTSTGPNITYTWTDGSGAFFSNDYQPEVTIPSQYRLTVTDTNTGETAVDAVFINEDFDIPEFQIVSPTNTLTCENPTAILRAVLDNPFLVVTYEWNGPGITGVTDDRIVASAGGSYALTVTNPHNGCLIEMQYEILENFENATTNIDHGTFSNFPIEIDAGSFITNPSATYSWEARNGLQVDDFPVAIISQPGDYTFLEDLGSASCVNRYVFEVLGVGTVADAGPDQTLACNMTTAVLGSNATSFGPDFTYIWTDEFGNQVGTTPFIEVNFPGAYTLTVFNTQNNTFDSDEVLISEDGVIVEVQIPIPDILDCENTIVTIQGFTLGGTNLEFQWSTFNGNILSNDQLPNIDVDQPGEYTLEVTDLSNGCNTISVVAVDQNIDGGSFDIDPIQSSLYPITLTADDFPTGLNLDLAWTPAQGLTVTNTTTAEIAQPGQYTFVATNTETGCDYNYVYTVYDNVLADAGMSQSLTCDINSVILGGTNSTTGSNIEYSWIDPNNQQIANSSTVEVNESGLYTLLVSDVMTGETIQDQVLVDEDFDEPLIVVRSPAPITIDDPITLIDARLFSPDAAIAEFSWSSFGGNIVSDPNAEDIEVDKVGIYELTVTNILNGCSSTNALEVVQNFDSEIILLENIVVNSFPVDLDPSAVVADTSGLMHHPYPLERSSSFEFKWVERQGLVITDFPLAQANQAGIYAFLKVDLTTGFVTRYEYDVDLMSASVIADAGSDIVLDCSTTTILDLTLGGENTSEGSEFTYEWTDANGIVVSNERFFTLSGNLPLEGFPYTLVVTNTTTGEQASDTITFIEDFVIPTVTTESVVTWTCSETSGVLSIMVANPTDQFMVDWTTSNGSIISDPTQMDITVDAIGTYTYTVTDLDNGCSTSGEVSVKLDTNDLELSLNITDVSCFGADDGSIDILVTGGTSPYTFDDLSQMELSPGTYTVSVTDANGCMTIAEGAISEPDPLAIDFTINANNQIEAIVTGGVEAYTYDWNVEADSNIIDNPVNGTDYELTVTDANGCELTDTFLFQTNAVFSPSAKEISVYPNPTDGLLHLQLDTQVGLEETQLAIFDIQGIRMYLGRRVISKSEITLDLNHLQAGAYILHATIGDELYYQKVIVF